MLQQSGNKVIMVQDECWADGRVNDALKLEERLRSLSVRVSMVNVDSMQSKVVDLIRKNLAKSKTDTFARKPIVVFARTDELAAKLHQHLKEQLTEVKKMTLLKESATIEECSDLDKYTVIVTSDEVLRTTIDFGFSFVPLIIHYNMPATRQVLLARLSKARRGFNSSHIAKFGQMQLRTELVIPLGQMEPIHEQFISREQFEDLKLYLRRVNAKMPDALEIIDIEAKIFDCSKCYVVGEHRDSSRFDCPGAQQEAIWSLGR